ncbi:MAG TPA: DinB family protein, partial [Panacibacter sp.]|nr:DinB family protein [Panacibacter sp.]
MQLIQKPTSGYASFYQPYLDCVPDDENLLQHLKDIITETEVLIAPLSEEQLLHRYSAGKWTIKDIVLHLADCERIIIYRATRIARADATVLPGFDENL